MGQQADHRMNSGWRNMPLGITPQQTSSARSPTRKVTSTQVSRP